MAIGTYISAKLRRDFLVSLWVIGCLLSLAAQAASKPLLWQVQDKNSQVRLYLFGSLHYGTENFYPLPSEVLNAYEESDALAVELDIDALNTQHVRNLLQHHGYYVGAETLQSRMSAQTWQELKNISHSVTMDLQQLMQLKPWLAAMQLTNLQLARSGYQQSLGLDKFFLTRARNKKTVLELESLEEQIQLFSQLSNAEQLAFLQITLNDFHSGQESLNKLAEAWHRGDEQQLNSLVFTAFRKQGVSEKLYQLIFVARNKQMLIAIDEYMKTVPKIFLVVGVGHMLGEDGLVVLLEQKGYRVTRVLPSVIDEM